MTLAETVDGLQCPTTGERLSIVDLAADNPAGLTDADLVTVRRTGGDGPTIGPTPRIVLVESGTHAYPVIGEFAVLLAPERLVRRTELQDHDVVDLRNPKYAEAYEEMGVYNSAGEDRLKPEPHDDRHGPMGALSGHPSISDVAATFPQPESVWIDARHDSVSQLEAYQYLAPVRDKVYLQVGGSGSHAVKALLAGAERAVLLTPMVGEARLAVHLAEAFGVADRLSAVIAVGEELPFVDDSVDRVYSGGCFHHMRLEHVAGELHRVLKSGGKFSGVDPWKTPLHTYGTKLIGKREADVYCKPMTHERLAPMQVQFPGMTISRHGPILRYAFLALEKASLKLPAGVMLKIARFDDSFGRLLGVTDNLGGSLVIAGTK